MASAAAVVAGELTTLDAFDAYRVRRGWAKQVPVQTQARADIPRQYATLERGQVTAAGAARAPTRAVVAVEVGVDDEPWTPAELAGGLGAEARRQWRWRWPAPPGHHLVQVRATDGTGQPQPRTDHGPFPDGATGHHTAAVTVP